MLNTINSNEILKNCVKQGLQGIKSCDRSKFNVSNTKKLNISIDLDECLKSLYPNDNRWDYLLIVYDEVEGYFVEIHPANTSDVAVMIAKKNWLKKEILDKLFSSVCRSKYKIVWVATNGVHILKTSKQYKQLIKENLLPKRVCVI